MTSSLRIILYAYAAKMLRTWHIMCVYDVYMFSSFVEARSTHPTQPMVNSFDLWRIRFLDVFSRNLSKCKLFTCLHRRSKWPKVVCMTEIFLKVPGFLVASWWNAKLIYFTRLYPDSKQNMHAKHEDFQMSSDQNPGCLFIFVGLYYQVVWVIIIS